MKNSMPTQTGQGLCTILSTLELAGGSVHKDVPLHLQQDQTI